MLVGCWLRAKEVSHGPSCALGNHGDDSRSREKLKNMEPPFLHFWVEWAESLRG
jgi:hypothetical protein